MRQRGTNGFVVEMVMRLGFIGFKPLVPLFLALPRDGLVRMGVDGVRALGAIWGIPK